MTKHLAVLYPLRLILDDVIREYPALCEPLNDDFNRLNLLVKNRGETVLTVDLPIMGKAYDRGFQTGILDRSSFPHTLGSWRKKNEIFHHLLCQTYRTSGELVYPEPDIVFFTRCILYAFKKLNRQSPDSAKTIAVKDFLKVEKDLSEPSREWNDLHPYLPGNGRLSFQSLDVGDSFNLLLGTLDRVSGILGFNRSPDSRVFKFKHGPGAVSDKRRIDDKYDHLTWPQRASIQFPYSEIAMQENAFIWKGYTPSRQNVAAKLIAASVNSLRKVDIFPFSEANGFEYVNPTAKLIAVPKTYDKPRLIASEPTANQFLQQGLLSWMRDNLHPTLRLSIDFLSQEPSKEVCQLASLSDDLATVDLSAASDRMTCKVVERLFSSNENFLQLLYASRTSRITNGVDDSFIETDLKKFAAMGSAVTFPVQTILYVCCAITAIIYDRKLQPTTKQIRSIAREVRVFGDDIVLPSSSVDTLDSLLTLLELKVNKEKSFTAGPFRESCGMDAYQGYDVTPCYIRTDCPSEKVDNLQSWVDVSNNAYRKGLWALATGMIDMLPEFIQNNLYVHNKEQPFVVLLSYSACELHHLKKNYIPIKREQLRKSESKRLGSNDFQRWVIPVLQEHKQSKKSSRDNILSLTQYFTESPDPNLLWEAGYGENIYKRKFKRLWAHPKG